MEKWPNFFIVGADKAGTSSLYGYLYQIPEVFLSRIKEPNYFSISTISDDHPLKPIRDKKKYLNLFKNVQDEKIIGEASPSYLSDPNAPQLIHQVSPNAKILISLRDPAERVYSHYLMLKRISPEISTFHKQLEISLNEKNKPKEDRLRLENGLYFQHVQNYLTVFGKDQVKIIIFEDLVKDTKSILQEILNFLNLKNELNDFKPEVYNKYGEVRGSLSQKILQNRTIRRISEVLISPSKRRVLKEKFIIKEKMKPELENNDRKLLINYYNEDVQKIKNLLGRELPWKNFLNEK